MMLWTLGGFALDRRLETKERHGQLWSAEEDEILIRFYGGHKRWEHRWDGIFVRGRTRGATLMRVSTLRRRGII